MQVVIRGNDSMQKQSEQGQGQGQKAKGKGKGKGKGDVLWQSAQVHV